METSRQPTVAQRKFAAGVAAGLPRTKAYKAAYPQSRLNPQSLRVKASSAARSAAVVAEIERLLAIPIVFAACPQADDPRALREHAVATMAQLTKHTDGVIAMHAAQWLCDYADRLEAQQIHSKTDGRAAILAELRELYTQALPPIVEAVAEPLPGAADAPAPET